MTQEEYVRIYLAMSRLSSSPRLNPGFSYPQPIAVQKQMVLLLMGPQKVHRSLTLCLMATSLPSLRLITQASYHLTSSQEGLVQYNKIKDHIHIFIIVYCYKCSISLLAIVVIFLFCIIYKLSFIHSMYVQEKCVFRAWYYPPFQ